MIEFLEAIRDFTETGGQVLLVIGLLIFVMWLLILERAMYLMLWHKQAKKEAIAMWTARADRSSWFAEQVRQKTISQLTMRLNGSIPIIQSLVALCPLLGLMGTVTGMIQVFQQITVYGAGDPTIMAGGISQALMTTVLGIVVAIPTIFMHTVVKSRSDSIIHILEEQATGMIAQKAERAAGGS
mgnify:CR=1 FL=1